MSHDDTFPSIAGQVRELDVDPGHLAVWALGQHGFLFKSAGKVVIIDPYLSNSVEEMVGSEEVKRLVPIVVPPDELDMVDLVLVTHNHIDHCDLKTLDPLLKAAPNAPVVTSYKGRESLGELDIDMSRVTVPTIDESFSYGNDLTVTAIPAAHYEQEPDANGNPAYLGFIISFNGVTVYHSGDTVIYEGLVERLKQQPIDLLCLPINGRDWFREQNNIVGNMDYREAAELTATVNGKVLLPAHNDMFKGNRINPAYLLDYVSSRYPRQRVHFLQAGELYYYVP
jgi:L-ascorbate 6-phosphate lactonase